MVLQEKIVTESLQKLGDRIAAQKNEDGSMASPVDEKSHGLSPEQKKAFHDRLRDGEHLLQDLQERIAASASEYESHAAEIREKCRITEENLLHLRNLSGKVSSIQFPAEEKTDLVQLADAMHELSNLRIQWAALDALLKKEFHGKMFSKDNLTVPAFPLKKAVVAFGLILFVCTLFLAAAIIVAWKVPF